MSNETNLTFLESLEFNNETEIFTIYNEDDTEGYPSTTTLNNSFTGTEIYETTSVNPSVAPTVFPLSLISESWVIPLLVLSTVNLVAVLFFEIYVLCKSCGTRRHLFLGQTLLLGLLLCSLLGYAYVLTPTTFICGLTRAGLGLVYTLVFATLLVKCLFLLRLHSGVYINSAYKALLIFFAFGIQVTISTQWLVYVAPEVVGSDEVPQKDVCKIQPVERVMYLAYVMLLIVMVCIAAVRSRSLKENSNEARYIAASVGILVIIWVSWVAVLIIFQRRYENPAQGFGLVCSSIVVFLLVFVPKAVHLSSSQKNGSTTGSHSLVYAPSFLHLQPHSVLPSYGDGSSTTFKQPPGSSADYCRGYTSRLWRYDYPTFQHEPPGFSPSDRSSHRKPLPNTKSSF